MANKVPPTLESAGRLNLKPVEDDAKPERSFEFEAEGDGQTCYMSPRMDGQRYIYY